MMQYADCFKCHPTTFGSTSQICWPPCMCPANISPLHSRRHTETHKRGLLFKRVSVTTAGSHQAPFTEGTEARPSSPSPPACFPFLPDLSADQSCQRTSPIFWLSEDRTQRLKRTHHWEPEIRTPCSGFSWGGKNERCYFFFNVLLYDYLSVAGSLYQMAYIINRIKVTKHEGKHGPKAPRLDMKQQQSFIFFTGQKLRMILKANEETEWPYNE